MTMNERLRKRLLLAFITVLATAVNLLEAGLPLPVPFVRPGLGNVAGLVALALWGFPEAATVTLGRVALASLAGGNILGPGFLLAAGGSLAALGAMRLLAATGLFSLIGVSLGAAFIHTLAQLALLTWILGRSPAVVHLAPPLLLLAVPAGLLTGWMAMRARSSLEAYLESTRPEEREARP